MKRIILLLAVLVAALFAAAPAQAAYPPYSEPECTTPPFNGSVNNFLTRCEAQRAMLGQGNAVNTVVTPYGTWAPRPYSCNGYLQDKLRGESIIDLLWIGASNCNNVNGVGSGFARINDISGYTNITYYDEYTRKWVRWMGTVRESGACPGGACVASVVNMTTYGSY